MPEQRIAARRLRDQIARGPADVRTAEAGDRVGNAKVADNRCEDRQFGKVAQAAIGAEAFAVLVVEIVERGPGDIPPFIDLGFREQPLDSDEAVIVERSRQIARHAVTSPNTGYVSL